MLNISEIDGSATLTIRVVPRASRSEIVGTIEGALKVRIASPPVDGAANAELIRLLSKFLGVSKSSVEIISGDTSRSKQLRITGVTAAQLRAAIEQ